MKRQREEVSSEEASVKTEDEEDEKEFISKRKRRASILPGCVGYNDAILVGFDSINLSLSDFADPNASRSETESAEPYEDGEREEQESIFSTNYNFFQVATYFKFQNNNVFSGTGRDLHVHYG